MNSAVQVCWEKATRYLEIEEKFVNCSTYNTRRCYARFTYNGKLTAGLIIPFLAHERYVIDPQAAVDLVDENTVRLPLPILPLPSFFSSFCELTSALYIFRSVRSVLLES